MKNTLLIGDHLIMSRFGYDVGIPSRTFTRRSGALPNASNRNLSPCSSRRYFRCHQGAVIAFRETIGCSRWSRYIKRQHPSRKITPLAALSLVAPMSFVQQATGKSTLLRSPFRRTVFSWMGDKPREIPWTAASSAAFRATTSSARPS